MAYFFSVQVPALHSAFKSPPAQASAGHILWGGCAHASFTLATQAFVPAVDVPQPVQHWRSPSRLSCTVAQSASALHFASTGGSVFDALAVELALAEGAADGAAGGATAALEAAGEAGVGSAVTGAAGLAGGAVSS
jgi:hypothetical protein